MKKVIKTTGYKAFRHNEKTLEFYCMPNTKKFVYPIGTTVSIKGKLTPCSNGLHFCKEAEDVFDYYNLAGNIDYFYGVVSTEDEVVEHTEHVYDYTDKKIIASYTKSVTRSLKLERILSTREFLKFQKKYKQNGGAKVIKDLRELDYDFCFNTPGLYFRYMQLKNLGKKISGTVLYFKNADGAYNNSKRLIMEIH